LNNGLKRSFRLKKLCSLRWD